MSEKKKIRFNVIDAIVLVVIIAVVAFVGIKLFGGEVASNLASGNYYTVTYYIEESPSFAAENIEVGAPVSDEGKNVPLGKVTAVELGESVMFAANDEGKMIKSGKEGYNSVTLTTEVQAAEFDHGIEVNNVKYVVGHTMTLYAGKAKLYGRIAGIEKK